MATEAESIQLNNDLGHDQQYIETLEKVQQLSPRDILTWTREEGRISYVGPWKVQRMQTVIVNKPFEEAELRRLINHVKFRLWLELRDVGKQNIADKMLGR